MDNNSINNNIASAITSANVNKFKRIIYNKNKLSNLKINRIYWHLQHSINYYRFFVEVHNNQIIINKLNRLIKIQNILQNYINKNNININYNI